MRDTTLKSKNYFLFTAALILLAANAIAGESVSAAGARNPAPTAASVPEGKSWTSELADSCKSKDAVQFNDSLEQSRRNLATELNKLKPEEYKKLNEEDDARIVFMKMTWPKDISFKNDRFSSDSDRSYCAKLHKSARDNVASTSVTKAPTLKAIRDFENCANYQFNGNNERPLPSPLKELVACYREKAQSKR